jgi:DNA-binding NarL/FixJ family response regulator
MIKVLIVDDHKMFVEGLEKFINDSAIAHVIATANTCENCWKELQKQQPDIVLLDINLPDASGIDLCTQIIAKYPQIKILALTSFAEYAVIRRVLTNGAAGYILKSAAAETILEGIEAISCGQQFLCKEVDTRIKKQASTTVVLTAREQELLRLIIDGYTNVEIADKMFLGVETINSYRKNLLCKLNARNTAVLVKMAIEQKLV